MSQLLDYPPPLGGIMYLATGGSKDGEEGGEGGGSYLEQEGDIEGPYYTCGACGHVPLREGDATCPACGDVPDWDNIDMSEAPDGAQEHTADYD